MFKNSFQFLNKTYTGLVQKINHQPNQFVIFGIQPWVGNIPEKLVYISNPSKDQLVFQLFDITNSSLFSLIGETIFHSLSSTKDCCAFIKKATRTKLAAIDKLFIKKIHCKNKKLLNPMNPAMICIIFMFLTIDFVSC